MSVRIIETVGTLIKKEGLSSVQNETNSNKLVLESHLPYPGYHGDTVPDNLEPDSLFAITKFQYNDERVIRAIQQVKKENGHTFDAAPGSCQLQNENVNFVRFKQLAYENVGPVVDAFTKNGIEFRRAKRITPYETLIRVRKFFRLKETVAGIYSDHYDKNTFYIEIPAFLRWAAFERITMNIKYNIDDKLFDAAQTSVYGEEGLIDFVRIYDEKSCQGKLLHIREKYLEAISKL